MLEFSKIVKEKTENTRVQLFRYLIVGGLAFILDYGTLFTLTYYYRINYLISAAIAFFLGLIFNYALSTKWIFYDSRLKNKVTEFSIFTIIGVTGLVLNELIMFIGYDIFHIHYMISKLISTGLVFLWNFFARKYILFTKKLNNVI